MIAILRRIEHRLKVEALRRLLALLDGALELLSHLELLQLRCAGLVEAQAFLGHLEII